MALCVHEQIKNIDLAVEAVTGVTPQQLRSERRPQEIARARCMAWRICRDELDLSYPAIGRAYGRDHSTIMTSIKERFPGLMRADAAFREQFQAVCAELKR